MRIKSMPIPSFDSFIDPLLRLLTEHPGGLATAEAQRLLAEQFAIGPDQKRELLPSGTYPVYKSRIGWAHDRLKREGLSSSPKRGFWQITDKGIAYARANPKLCADELKRLAYPKQRTAPLASDESPEGSPPNDSVGVDSLLGTPDDRIGSALSEIEDSLRTDLLARIRNRDPEFFEGLVLKVLRAMGYGADEDSLEQSGGPGDDGIDGVISLDRLGLDRVYVQAKRYAEDRPITKEAIHGFIGALHLKGANKGVFITTSRFTAGAARAAAEVRALSLRLVDGVELTRLMICYQVGVRHESIAIPKVDLDFWDDE
ncbi:restriction endonuclease [Thiorhodovibrio winogradskyi]|nr:restriction endonuclease [Thiorhodovibrio winogradskyi]